MVKNAPKKEENPYPPWFFRVLGPCVLSDRSPSGYEFDEDLSDLASERTAGEEEQPTKKRRKLEDSDKESDEDEDKEDDEEEDDDKDDSTSERSHADSLADVYYEFKEIREERKRELERERQDILFMIQSESEIESQVNQAYRSFIDAPKEDKLTSMLSLHATTYIIHCRDQPKYFYNGLGPGYVEFYHLSVEDNFGSNPPPDFDPKRMHGHIYINASNGVQFEPFDPPEEFSGSDFIISPVPSGPHDVRIKFFSRDCIKMSLPKELTFENKEPPADAPDLFEYVGVRRDWEKWKAERKRMWEEAEKNRPPSPRDSWFERTHPVGYWNQGQW
ncbi:uncharacterized protein N7496_010643 [Penicillium cataractarum]|uniref:Uncharacterized protein n=1 Tax=Penicillium cataractarum TaxID=2100454 RepID=A0A9W9V3A8_9EURO|nr:uncharacterized protein N7496_010643 [Penicillium cataractarum]KAJ5364930.1 hypothetical protein N7496_010643 [Penicillium cataractarum]